ncbi:MAG TPA: serine/threonine-protein kinase, partial [Candidatus Obscuribacterales bacterium]
LNHFEANGYCYWVQEWIDGANLATLLAEQGLLSESQIWQLLNDALPVLQFIHSHQVIHRDIKPTNLIRRSSDSCLFLVDFGAAKLVEESYWQPFDTSLGSPEYAAPEQAKGKATFASDLYSLGVTCIHLLTGIPPFELFDAVNDRWIWRSYLTQSVSDRLAQLLDQLIQNALSQRYQTAAEVITLVQAELRSRSWVTAMPSVAAPAPTSNRLWQCQHTLTDPFSSMTSVNSLAFSADGQWLASGSDDKTVRLWNLAARTPIQRLTEHDRAIQAVAFSPDSQWLASGSDDKTVRLWDLDGKLIRRLSGHTHAVKSVAFSPNGQLLASGSWDKTIRLWEAATGNQVVTLT